MNTADMALDPLDSEVREAARSWWLLLVGGLISMVFGVALLVWPERTLTTIAILLGIYLLIVGLLLICLLFFERPGSRAGLLLRGVLAVVAGLIVIRHPGGSILVVAMAIGILLVVSGIIKLVAATDAVAGRGWLLLGAVVDLAIGVVLVAWPQFGVTSLAVLLGIVLILRGVVEAACAFVLRSAAA
jgi:uncharacterized membrane protein HdeD (DUF308 family)